MNRFKSWLEQRRSDLLIVVLHVVAWVLYFMFFWLAFITQTADRDYRLWYLIIIALIDIPLFYYFYVRTIPKLLAGKAWLFILITLVATGLYPLLKWVTDQPLIYFFQERTGPFANISTSQFWTVYWVRAFGGLFVIAMAGIGKFTFDWFKNLRIREQLEHQNMNSELAFLKTQINPHFLFNTLNNIHTLAYKKADDAPEAIMKLSELMRYMIYESNADQVSLTTELQYLESFIGLQELRFKEKNRVRLKTEGDLQGRKIAPLLLMPFVENAFKHGLVPGREGKIDIELRANERIHFQVTNPVPTGLKLQKDEAGGIGLQNIQRRLELIYPGKHQLDIKADEESYTVNLTLNDHG